MLTPRQEVQTSLEAMYANAEAAAEQGVTSAQRALDEAVEAVNRFLLDDHLDLVAKDGERDELQKRLRRPTGESPAVTAAQLVVDQYLAEHPEYAVKDAARRELLESLWQAKERRHIAARMPRFLLVFRRPAPRQLIATEDAIISDLRTQIDSLNDELTVGDREIKPLRDALYAERSAAAKTTKAELKAQIKALNAELAPFDRERESLKRAIDQASWRLRCAKERLTALQNAPAYLVEEATTPRVCS
jgi:hypothetical protein